MSASRSGSPVAPILPILSAPSGKRRKSPSSRDLFDHAYTLVDGHAVDQSLRFNDGTYAVAPAVFRCAPGLGLQAPVDARALEVLLECGGDRRLGDLVAATAEARGESVDEVRALVEPTVRQLVEKGFMVPAASERTGGQTW